MEDMVNHPKHYEDGCSIECIHMMWTFLGLKGVIMFCLGNAYKYMWRHKLKNDAKEDLAKAKWYIDEALWMLEDLYNEDEEEYAWVFPKLCELLRLHNLYSAQDLTSTDIKKKLEEMDGRYDYEDLKKYWDELYGREVKIASNAGHFARAMEKFWENIDKEKEDENQKDWKKVYDYLNSYPTIDNGYPNDPITSAFKICEKHCKRDS